MFFKIKTIKLLLLHFYFILVLNPVIPIQLQYNFHQIFYYQNPIKTY